MVQTQEEQEEHTMIQCEMMLWMVKSTWFLVMPRLPPEPSPREHELTGHAVYRSWCRHCAASKGRTHAYASREEGELPELGIDYGFFGRDREDVLSILCVKCRHSSTRCLAATVVALERCVRRCEFATDCTHREFGSQEDPGEVRQRTITVDLDRTCLDQLARSCSDWPRGGQCP